MTVRRLRADETALLKALRLRALADAPDAFAHTHAEISAKPDAYWEEMRRSVTEPAGHAMFVAETAGTPVGMVFGLWIANAPPGPISAACGSIPTSASRDVAARSPRRSSPGRASARWSTSCCG